MESSSLANKNIYLIIAALSVGFVLEKLERFFLVRQAGLISSSVTEEVIAGLGFIGLIILTYALLKGNAILGYILASLGGLGLCFSSYAWYRLIGSTGTTTLILIVQLGIILAIVTSLIRLRIGRFSC